MKTETINLIYATWQDIESNEPDISTERLIAEVKDELRTKGVSVDESDIVKAMAYKEKKKDRKFIRKETKLKSQIYTKKQIILALSKPTAVQPQILLETRKELQELQEKLDILRGQL